MILFSLILILLGCAGKPIDFNMNKEFNEKEFLELRFKKRDGDLIDKCIELAQEVDTREIDFYKDGVSLPSFFYVSLRDVEDAKEFNERLIATIKGRNKEDPDEEIKEIFSRIDGDDDMPADCALKYKDPQFLVDVMNKGGIVRMDDPRTIVTERSYGLINGMNFLHRFVLMSEWNYEQTICLLDNLMEGGDIKVSILEKIVNFKNIRVEHLIISFIRSEPKQFEDLASQYWCNSAIDSIIINGSLSFAKDLVAICPDMFNKRSNELVSTNRRWRKKSLVKKMWVKKCVNAEKRRWIKNFF